MQQPPYPPPNTPPAYPPQSYAAPPAAGPHPPPTPQGYAPPGFPQGAPPLAAAAYQAPPLNTNPAVYFQGMADAGIGTEKHPDYEPGEYECILEEWLFQDDAEYGPRVIVVSRIQEVISGPSILGMSRKVWRSLRPQPRDPSKRQGAIAAARKDLNTIIASILGGDWEAIRPHAEQIYAVLATNPAGVIGARHHIRADLTGKTNTNGKHQVRTSWSPSRHGANVTIQSVLAGQSQPMPPPPAQIQVAASPTAALPPTLPLPVAGPPPVAAAPVAAPKWGGYEWVYPHDPRWASLA